MSSNLEPEEVEAIMDLTTPATGAVRASLEVSPRNFSQPQRLSPDELGDARERARRGIKAVAERFTGALRGAHALEVVQVDEVSAAKLCADTSEPFAIAKFDVAGQPGWLVWEVPAALAAAELLLGALEPGEQAPRRFSALERRALERLLSPLVTELGTALGVAPAGLQVVQSVDEIGRWTDAGDHAEPSRLRIHLAFQGPGGESAFDLYLPGINPRRRRDAAPVPNAALPGHLGPVTVNLSARLGANHVPLAELLSIEVGDVIPLATPIDEPLRLYVEDVPHPCGRGYLGSKQGNLAIRLVQIGLEDEEN